MKFKNIIFFSVLASLLVTLFLPVSCVKEEDFNTDTSLNLKFSADTVTFDTVFTTLGTITKQILVYNSSDKAIKIESVMLGGGRLSPFRLNVDGDTSLVVKDVEIGANDYMYIFVTATINPNKSTNPFIVRDSVEFYFNSKRQYLQLMAFGQNAIYHYSPEGSTIADCSQSWTAGLPHVIYGDCLVESGSTLTIEDGTRIYFGNKSSLKIKNGATLKVNGMASNPVLFTSMRKDDQYENLGGQWNSIHLAAGSLNNTMNWAVIRNGSTGIQIDSAVNTNPTLKITNTVIENMSEAGLAAQKAIIEANNLLVDNCQYYTLALIGGSYEFLHCTFANYWNVVNTSRKTPSIYIANYTNDTNGTAIPLPLNNVLFGNCIVYGSMQEELSINIKDIATGNYYFDYCLLRTQKATSNSQYFNECFNKDPLFDSIAGHNFRLKSNSPAKGIGASNYATLVPYDLDNQSRNTISPTLGAYEIRQNK